MRNRTNRQDIFWYVVVISICTIYYTIFSFSIAMPQMGWWQYYGWRITQGEIPYVDFYLYLPPYYVLLSALLYTIFHNKIIMYVIFGLIIYKIPTWSIMYLLLRRGANSVYSAIGTAFGVVITSVFAMDLTCDYNLLVTLLFIWSIYAIVRAYEEKSSNKALVWVACAGILSGNIFMLKQNVGLAMPVIVLGLLFISRYWGSCEKIKKKVVIYIIGMMAAILPGVIYLAKNHALVECAKCIISASGAKGVGNGFLLQTLRNFWRPNCIGIAFLIFALLYFFVERNKKSSFRAKLFLILAITFGVNSTIYINPITSFINGNEHAGMRIKIVLFILFLTFITLNISSNKKNLEKYSTILNIILLVTLIICMIGITYLSVEQRRDIYESTDLFSLRRSMLYVIIYGDLIIWIQETIKLLKRDTVNLPYYLAFTGLLFYMGISFTSAPLEEVFGIVFVPFFITNLMSEKIGDYTKTKNYSIAIICMLTIILCLSEKITKPYEWHSWRVPALYDKDNEMVRSSVDGLEGLLIPQSDEEKYQSIIANIYRYSDAEDMVYQFPNVMLFNVLTERKTVYAAVPYFDVLPDDEAEKSAKELTEKQPKMVIWSNINEDRWLAHEYQYRNGNKCGQRKLQKWFDHCVKLNYRCVGLYENNEDEGDSISLWVKNAFSGGEPTEPRVIKKGNNVISQQLVFNDNNFKKYVFRITADDEKKLENQMVEITLKNRDNRIVDKTTAFMKKEADAYYYVDAPENIEIECGEVYTCEVNFIDVDDKLYLYHSAKNTASKDVFAYDKDNVYNYNYCIYFE